MPRKLYLDDFAALVGVKPQTLRAYRALSKARFPKADGVDIERGKARPWWSPETVEAWRSNRPGSGNWGSRHARAASP